MSTHLGRVPDRGNNTLACSDQVFEDTLDSAHLGPICCSGKAPPLNMKRNTSRNTDTVPRDQHVFKTDYYRYISNVPARFPPSSTLTPFPSVFYASLYDTSIIKPYVPQLSSFCIFLCQPSILITRLIPICPP